MWKLEKELKRVLFVTDSIQFIHRIPYKRSTWTSWSLQNRRQVIGPAKCANNELLAKHETIIQGMTDRLIEFGRCCEMEMNVEKD